MLVLVGCVAPVTIILLVLRRLVHTSMILTMIFIMEVSCLGRKMRFGGSSYNKAHRFRFGYYADRDVEPNSSSLYDRCKQSGFWKDARS